MPGWRGTLGLVLRRPASACLERVWRIPFEIPRGFLMPRFVYDLSSTQMVILLTFAGRRRLVRDDLLRPLVRSFIRRETGANDKVFLILGTYVLGMLTGLGAVGLAKLAMT